MPVRVIAGKNKHGNEKVLHYPNELIDARGKVAWREWEVKNPYRERQSVSLLDSRGRTNGERIGVVLGPNGKPIPLTISTILTAKEIHEALTQARTLHETHSQKNGTKRLRDAGTTLSVIEDISKKRGLTESERARTTMYTLLKDPFFGTALINHQLQIPTKLPLTTKIIKEAAQDFFFSAYLKEKKEKDAHYADATLLSHGKDVTLVNRWTKITKK